MTPPLQHRLPSAAGSLRNAGAGDGVDDGRELVSFPCRHKMEPVPAPGVSLWPAECRSPEWIGTMAVVSRTVPAHSYFLAVCGTSARGLS